jgi:hypothetical protein
MVRTILMYVFGLGLILGWFALMNTYPYLAIGILVIAVIIWLVLRATRTQRLDWKIDNVNTKGVMKANTQYGARYEGIRCPYCYTVLQSRDDYDQEAFKEGELKCGKCKNEIILPS